MAGFSHVFLYTLVLLLQLNSVLVKADCTVQKTADDMISLECDVAGIGHVTVDLEFKSCREYPSLSVRIDIPNLGIHESKSGISHLSIPLAALGALELSLTSEGYDGDQLTISYNPPIVPRVKIYSESLPSDDLCNPVLYWINSQSQGLVIGLGVGITVLLVLLCYCCCRCCCSGKSRASPGVIIVPGSQPMAPQTVQSSIPYARVV